MNKLVSTLAAILVLFLCLSLSAYADVIWIPPLRRWNPILLIILLLVIALIIAGIILLVIRRTKKKKEREKG